MRTGLLGASAAMAMGAVAVASGLVPGPGGLGGDQGDDHVRADAPSELEDQALPSASDSATTASDSPSRSERSADEQETTSRDKERKSPESSPSSSAEKTSEPTPERSSSSGEGSSGKASQSESGGSNSSASAQPSKEPSEKESSSSAPQSTKSAQTPDAQTAAETEVLQLVNQERAKAGCQPVTADKSLGGLADDFSADMAKRGYFSHNTPDGQTPWDRAEARGIDNLGGENIARGQANAQSVMDSWMNSSGHKANILNCDYQTLGVSAHFGEGGPWWVQEFGF